MKRLIAGWLVGVVLMGTWFDAMDTRYGVKNAAHGYLVTTSAALMWPVFLPLSMLMIAVGGGGRWTLPSIGRQ